MEKATCFPKLLYYFNPNPMKPLTTPIYIFLALFFFSSFLYAQECTIQVRVNSPEDDLEEYLAGANQTQLVGSKDKGSTDLELGAENRDGRDPQLVGIRFAHVNIPPGARIIRASIRFTVDEDKNEDPASFTIRAQNASNPNSFNENITFDITSRATLAESVVWNVTEAWNTPEQSGNAQTTPDLSSLIQQLVDLPGWERRNAMVFTFEGTGIRTAVSADKSLDQAPLLEVSYDAGPPPQNVMYRINTGGPAVPAEDCSAPDWGADSKDLQSPFRIQGGTDFFLSSFNNTYQNPIGLSFPDLPGSVSPILFESERVDFVAQDTMHWELPVKPGSEVEVRLYFSELFNGITSAGSRVFDVEIEGVTPDILRDIDPYALGGGGNQASMRAQTVVVQDTGLSIIFKKKVQSPAIKAIEVVNVDPFANNLPVVSYPGVQTHLETDAVSLPIAAYDGNGNTQTLTFSAVGLPPGLSIDPNTGLISGIIPEGEEAADNSPYNVRITATDNGLGNLSGTVDFTWQISKRVSKTVLYRINVGGDAVPAADGSLPMWSADSEDNPSPYLRRGGEGFLLFGSPFSYQNPIDLSSPLLPPSVSEALFQSERWDPEDPPEMEWEFPVPTNNPIEVRIYLSELFNSINSIRERVFNVSVEDSVPQSFDDIDIYERTGGGNIALVLTHQQVVTDGLLNLKFLRKVDRENPSIKAIEILNVGEVNDNSPLVLNPGVQGGVEGDLVQLPIYAVGGNSVDDVITYTASGLPNGLMIDPNTGLITGTVGAGAEASSPFTVTVNVTDQTDPSLSTQIEFVWFIGPQTIYVDASAASGGDGSTWESAYTDLQDALQRARPGYQIWVAKGTYTPVSFSNSSISFELVEGVNIYGGFVGNEQSLDARAMDSMSLHVTNETILSGEIGNPSTVGDNSHHVIIANNLKQPTLIQGFTIRDGFAAGSPNPENGQYGGGLWVFKSNLRVQHCNFLNNNTQDSGGGFFCRNDTQDELELQMANCTFQNNGTNGRTFFGGGGFILNSKAVLSNCFFLGNQASTGGGLFTWSSNTTLDSCIFIGNTGTEGGGLGNNKESNIILNGCSFLENIANNSGGAMWNIESVEATLNDCIFRGNLSGNTGSTGNGGAIYNNGFSTKINNCVFEGNKSRIEGGAMYNDGTDVTIIGSTFFQNKAERGGGEIIRERGGALSNKGSIIQIDTCHFQGNEAPQGGAVYNALSEVGIKHCTFEANIAQTGEAKGGAVYNFRGNPLLEDCMFRDNEAQQGGALYNDISPVQMLRDTLMTSIANKGAGMYNLRSTTNIAACVIANNRALEMGGGIMMDSARVPLIQNTTFRGNQAVLRGGAMMSLLSSPELRGCTLYQNSAPEGGALYVEENVNILLQNCTLTQNTASDMGGGIASLQSRVRILAATFSENTSPMGSHIQHGLAPADTGQLMLQNSLFTQGQINFSNPTNAVSQGHNLFDDPNVFTAPLDLTDRVSEQASQLGPLQDNGGPTLTLAPLAGNPALGGGGPISTTALLLDQRNYSRITGSKQDSIDIGAFEYQSTHVIAPPALQICQGETTPLLLGDIVLADSTGGAWEIGNNQLLELEFPAGLQIVGQNSTLECEGEGLANCEVEIGERTLQISYDRLPTTTPSVIRLSGLAISQELEPGTYAFTRNGNGMTNQNDNDVDQGVSHANIWVFPSISSDQLPYDETFETGSGGWLAEENAAIWEWGVPAGNVIGGTSPTSNAWVTDLDGTYGPNVDTWVYSPCLDLSEIEGPVFSWKIWSDTEENLDGTVLQASTDNGLTWNTVGSVNTGINWYDSNALLSKPGDQPTNQSFGWTGRYGAWREAIHRLPGSLAQPNVRFRVAFKSVEFVNPEEQFEGFAFDDIAIGESSTTLLLEHFMDPSDTEGKDNIEELVSTFPNTLIPIRYHYRSIDPLFTANPAGPTARALYYGISEGDRSVLEGTAFNDLTENLSINQVSGGALERLLAPPAPFAISIDPTLSNTLSVTSFRDFTPDEEVGVFIALVENSSDNSFQYALRKFLPDAGGYSVWGWQSGQTETFSPLWENTDTPSPDIINNLDSVKVIAFVQHMQTKEVYQAISVAAWPGLIQNRLGGPDPEAEEQAITIYPNPVRDQVNLSFNIPLEEEVSVYLTDAKGIRRTIQQIPQDHTFAKIPTESLAAGVYVLEISDSQKRLARKKIVIMH